MIIRLLNIAHAPERMPAKEWKVMSPKMGTISGPPVFSGGQTLSESSLLSSPLSKSLRATRDNASMDEVTREPFDDRFDSGWD